jgi:arabinofuranosyltransferase
MTSLSRGLPIAWVIAVIVLSVAWLVTFWGFVVDDTYISYRYAVHWSHGLGFVWNVGEAPSEGFTNFLWVLVLGLSHKAGLDIELVSRVIGVGSLLALACVVALSVRRILGRREPLAESAGAALILLNPQLVSHSVSGMETLLYALAVSIIIWLTVRMALTLGLPSDLGWLQLSSAVLIAGLIRPEGGVFGAVCMSGLLLTRPSLLRSVSFWRSVSPVVLIAAAYFGWRWQHFGYLLPNPFYHKRSVHLLSDEGIRYVLHYIKYALPLAPFALMALRDVRRDVGALLVMAASTVFLYCGFFPEMGFSDRFTIQYYAIPVILAALGFAAVSRWLASRMGPRTATIAALVVVSVVTAIQAREYYQVAEFVGIQRNADATGGTRARLGRMLGALPSDVVMAAGEMGTMPWYSKLAAVDIAGLTDTWVTHHPTTLGYLRQRGVEVLIVPSHGETLEVAHASRENSSRFFQLFEQAAELKAEYQIVGCWRTKGFRYLVMIRRLSPRFKLLQATLDREGLPACSTGTAEAAS